MHFLLVMNPIEECLELACLCHAHSNTVVHKQYCHSGLLHVVFLLSSFRPGLSCQRLAQTFPGKEEVDLEMPSLSLSDAVVVRER